VIHSYYPATTAPGHRTSRPCRHPRLSPAGRDSPGHVRTLATPPHSLGSHVTEPTTAWSSTRSGPRPRSSGRTPSGFRTLKASRSDPLDEIHVCPPHRRPTQQAARHPKYRADRQRMKATTSQSPSPDKSCKVPPPRCRPKDTASRLSAGASEPTGSGEDRPYHRRQHQECHV